MFYKKTPQNGRKFAKKVCYLFNGHAKCKLCYVRNVKSEKKFIGLALDSTFTILLQKPFQNLRQGKHAYDMLLLKPIKSLFHLKLLISHLTN